MPPGGWYGPAVPVPSPASAAAERPAEERDYQVGIAGAGQLARMTCLAAWPLGLRVGVLGAPDEPAAAMAAGVVEGHWDDPPSVRALGRAAGVVTLENEFVEADVLAEV